MGDYGDMFKDAAHAAFLRDWVPETQEELGYDLDWDQYRFTLARARAAEARVKEMEGVIRPFTKLMKEIS